MGDDASMLLCLGAPGTSYYYTVLDKFLHIYDKSLFLLVAKVSIN
jgi:hypothetical protein